MTRPAIHTRSVICRGYLRVDGLWSIEGELKDSKGYDSVGTEGIRRAAGAPFHEMTICITVDDHLHIHEARSQMDAAPFQECQPAQTPLQRLVGQNMGAGWRSVIDSTMGGVAGCTHFRELLFALATVAYQTIPRYRAHERKTQGLAEQPVDMPPPHFGRCMGWDFDGPVMHRLRPEFAGLPTRTERDRNAAKLGPSIKFKIRKEEK